MAVETRSPVVRTAGAHAEKMGAVARLAHGLSHDVAELVDDAASSIHLALASNNGRKELFDAASTLQRAALIARQLEALGHPHARPIRSRSLSELVEEVLPLMRRLAGPGVTVATGELDPMAWTRSGTGQLEQVLFHLVVNGRDAMPSGGGRITIAVRSVDLTEGSGHPHGYLEPGAWSVLEVSDSGAGMDPDTQSRLFEPFFTTKPPGLGSGLGLATVYGIVTHLGGQVVVASSEGAGSTLGVWLPATAPAERLEATVPGTDPAILVVDDDEWVRSVTARSLRQAGHAVLEAESGDRALELLDDVVGARIRVVVADLSMPGMPGEELLRRIRTEHPDVKVVTMTGRGRKATGGAGVVLHKPFSRDELLAAIAGG